MARSRRLRTPSIVFSALLVLSLVASACSNGGGVPATPGLYAVQKDSVHFDGDRYQLYYADNNGSLHHLDTQKLRLVRDPDRTFLDVPQSGDPILHLKEDEPITVEGQDHQGAFSSPWFPFFLGAVVGNAFGGGRNGQTIIINNPAPGERSYDPATPTYRYPPTGSFSRDDTLHGSVDTSKPQAPDYTRVQPAPYATSAKASGTGGGVAATNKATGSSSSAGGASGSTSGASGSTSGASASTSGASGLSGGSNATSGQAGGTGSGVAASNKGGFANGTQSYANTQPGGSTSLSGSRSVGASNPAGGSNSVGAGSSGALKGSGSSGSSTTRPSTGFSGGSKGISGARAPSGRR